MGAFDDIIAHGQQWAAALAKAPYVYAEGRVTRSPIFFYDRDKVANDPAKDAAGVYSPGTSRWRALRDLLPDVDSADLWWDQYKATQGLDRTSAPPNPPGVIYIPMRSGAYQQFKKMGEYSPDTVQHEEVHAATAPFFDPFPNQIDATKVLTPEARGYLMGMLEAKGYARHWSDPGPRQSIEALSNLPGYAPEDVTVPRTDPNFQYRSMTMDRRTGKWIDMPTGDPVIARDYQKQILGDLLGAMQAMPGGKKATEQVLRLKDEDTRQELGDRLATAPSFPKMYQPPAPKEVPMNFWQRMVAALPR